MQLNNWKESVYNPFQNLLNIYIKVISLPILLLLKFKAIKSAPALFKNRLEISDCVNPISAIAIEAGSK